MGLLDIFKSKKQRKVEEKFKKRPSKGALKPVSTKVSASKEEVGKEKEGAKEGKSELASRVILAPHITEKSSFASEKNVYIFRVVPRANKDSVKRAVKELYGFIPLKVNLMNMPSKTRFSRGKTGRRPGFKKAAVYLKHGDKIDIS